MWLMPLMTCQLEYANVQAEQQLKQALLYHTNVSVPNKWMGMSIYEAAAAVPT